MKWIFSWKQFLFSCVNLSLYFIDSFFLIKTSFSFPVWFIVSCFFLQGCSFGYHAGGWGKPPVDENGKPLYGDVFGTQSSEFQVNSKQSSTNISPFINHRLMYIHVYEIELKCHGNCKIQSSTVGHIHYFFFRLQYQRKMWINLYGVKWKKSLHQRKSLKKRRRRRKIHQDWSLLGQRGELNENRQQLLKVPFHEFWSHWNIFKNDKLYVI